MKTLWILLFMTHTGHGAISLDAKIYAYESEYECNRAYDQKMADLDLFEVGEGRCRSVSSLMQEQKGRAQ